MSVCSTLAAAGLFAAAGPVPAPLPVAPPPRVVEQQLVQVFQLRNVAAADVARALAQYTSETGRITRVAPDLAANLVIVRGTGAGQAQLAGLITAIDAPRPQHLMQVVVAEVPRSFLTDCGVRTAADTVPVFTLTEREHRMLMAAVRASRDRISILSRPQMQVLDNQTGFVQVGQDFPVVTGVMPAGGTTRPEVTYRPTGLTVRVTPRLLPGGTTQMRAAVQYTVPGTAAGTTATATAVSFHTGEVQATWSTPAGATTVLAVPTANGAGRDVEVLIFVTPTVVKP